MNILDLRNRLPDGIALTPFTPETIAEAVDRLFPADERMVRDLSRGVILLKSSDICTLLTRSDFEDLLDPADKGIFSAKFYKGTLCGIALMTDVFLPRDKQFLEYSVLLKLEENELCLLHSD